MSFSSRIVSLSLPYCRCTDVKTCKISESEKITNVYCHCGAIFHFCFFICFNLGEFQLKRSEFEVQKQKLALAKPYKVKLSTFHCIWLKLLIRIAFSHSLSLSPFFHLHLHTYQHNHQLNSLIHPTLQFLFTKSSDRQWLLLLMSVCECEYACTH